MQISRDAKSSRFLYGFWRLRQKLLGRLEPPLKSHYDLDVLDLMLLRNLLSQPCTNPSELIERLHIPAYGVSRKLESLEAKGLIHRALDQNDKRKRCLSITEKGEQVLLESFSSVDQEINQFLKVFDEEELESFLQLLSKLTQ